MSSSTSSLTFPEYFTALAANYAKQTGDSTRLIFANVYDDITSIVPINEKSVIHDNAAGPGTAASVILGRKNYGKVLITDNVPAMVTAARDAFKSFPNVTVQEGDSLDLSNVADGSVSHSILNFSIFTMADPEKCLAEVHRTLKPGGVAAVLTWRRFAAGDLVHAAQNIVRPDLPPMRVPHPELLREGVLADLVVKSGFALDKMQVLEKTVVVKGENVEGLKGFMLSDFTKAARAGWTDDEVKQWPEVVEKVVAEEVGREGGVRFEAWVVLARR